MKDLSVIILSYNTQDLTLQAIESLMTSLKKSRLNGEIVVVDNGSTDGSIEALRKLRSTPCLPAGRNYELRILENKKNVGFGAGNNIAVKHAKGKYILFLNSDTIVDNVDFEKLLQIMDGRSDIGALTVKLLLPDGNIDPASHRGFPTLWRSFTYFSKLEKLTGSIPVLNRLFGGYHLTYLPLNAEHEIDSPSGAFFLTKKEIFDKLGGFDEEFFMYGEDIDLAWRIKETGYKIWYYPFQSVVHIKGQSGRKHEDESKKSQTSKHFYEAMKIFYKKHYEEAYPAFLNSVVYRLLELRIGLSIPSKKL